MNDPWEGVAAFLWVEKALGLKPRPMGILRERVVILLQGLNIFGEEVFSYVEMPLYELQYLRNAMELNENFKPSDFGRVLVNGRGKPSATLMLQMQASYNLVDLPKADASEG